MKKLLAIIALILFPLFASAATTFPVNGGTGSTTLTGIILGAGTSPVLTLKIGTGLQLLSGILSSTGINNFGTTSISATSPLIWNTTTANMSIQQANTSQSGYLSSTDWNTFNNKQAAGSYITALTGDGTASGPGSVAFTLATVNSNIGTFNNVTVNAKGLVTAASNVAYDTFGYLFPSNATTSALTLGGLTLSNLAGGGTLCVHVNNAGTFSTTASDCGSGTGSVTGVTATYPILSSGGTAPVISTAFGTTTNNGIGNNVFLYNSNSGVMQGAASSSLDLPNAALQNSTIGVTANSPLTGGGTPALGGSTSLGCQTASGSQAGCLSSTDWSTFNGKQAAGNYITALTGDITASGPGSVAATLATVNSNVGTFTYPSVTVNGKGLVTAISNGTAPTTYTGTFPINVSGSVISSLFSTTTNWGLNSNGLVVVGSTGIPYVAASSTLNLPNTALQNSTISGISLGSNLNSVTFNSSGSGATSGTTFNGGTAQTISYNTIGAQVAGTYVTSVGVTTNQGVSGSSSGGTTPNLTLTLGALTGVTSLNGLVVTANTGVITTGTWNGTTITVANGGTGANTLTGCLTGNGTGAITGSGTCNTSNATVSSVGLSVPSFLSIGGSPVTSAGTLAISYSGTALPIANGGTNATSFTTSGNGVYWNGTSLLTAPLTSAVTYPYASTTVLSASGQIFDAGLTSGNCVQASTGGLLTTTGSACGSGGGGAAYPFTPSTNFGIAVSATTTALFAQGGFFASSTIELGTSTVDVLNGIITATSMPGSDIGAKINNAYAFLPSTGGQIYVPAGSYSFSTAIVFGTNNKPVQLICAPGGATTLTYTGTATSTTFNTGFSTISAGNGVDGCTFSGTSDLGVGLGVGGTQGDPGIVLNDINIINFATGIVWGNNTWNTSLINSRVQNDNKLMLFYVPNNSGERMSFTNDVFADSLSGGQDGILFQANAVASASFTGTSFDDIGLGLASGNEATFTGDHFENPAWNTLSTYNYIEASSSQGTEVTVSGGFMLNDATTALKTPTQFVLNGAVVSLTGVSIESNNNNPTTKLPAVVNNFGSNASLTAIGILNGGADSYTVIATSSLAFGTDSLGGSFQTGLLTANLPFANLLTLNAGDPIGQLGLTEQALSVSNNPYSLLAHNQNSTNGSSTGIGFSVSSGDPVQGSGAVGAAIDFIRQGSGSYGDLSFITSPASNVLTEVMRLANTGNVGIGSSTPWARLSVNTVTGVSQATTAVFAVASSTAANATSTLFEVQSTGSTLIGTTTNSVSGSVFAEVISNSVQSFGGLLINTWTNVTNAFTIKNSVGATVFNIDTTATNPFLGVGTTTPWGTVSIVGNGTSPLLAVATTSNNGLPNFEVDVNGHEIFSGNVPVCTTNCTFVAGNDNAFRIKSGSAVTSETVTFAKSWGTLAPICVAEEGGAADAAVAASSTPTTVIITSASLTSADVEVQCEGIQ